MPDADRDADYQALLESLPLPYVATDLAGRITHWNRRYEALTGRSEESLRGASLAELLSAPEASDVLARGMGEVGAGRTFVTQYTTPGPSGEPTDYRIHVSGRRDAAGAVIGTQALVEDVTEFARLSRALADSEARYRELFEKAPVAYFLLDRELRFVRTNQRYADLLGLTPDQVVVGGDAQAVAERSLEIEAGADRVRTEVLGEGRALTLEFSLERFDGERRFVRAQMNPAHGADGSVVGVRGLVEDLTEIQRARTRLAESEAELRDLYENAPLAYYVLSPDRDLRLIRWNGRVAEFFGVDPSLLRVGLPIGELIRPTPESAAALARAFEQTVQRGESFSIEVEFVRLDGELRCARSHTRAIRNERGETAALISLTEDITDVRRAQRELRESDARLASIVESATDAIVSFDAEGKIVLFNGGAEQILGCPAAQAIGTPVARFATEQGLAVLGEVVARMDADPGARLFVGEEQGVHSRRLDGTTFVSEATFSRSSVGGKPVYTTIFRDADERRRVAAESDQLRARAEELTRELASHRELTAGIVESASDGILSYRADGTIMLCNESAAHTLRAPVHEIVGQSIWRYSTEETRRDTEAAIAHVDATPGARFYAGPDAGLRGIRSDGSVVGFEGTLSRSVVDGAPLYTLIFRDLDERRAQAEELDRLRNQSEYYQEELRQLHQFDDIVGRSRALAATLAQVSRVAPTESTVLILGETGVGKELIARAIHARSHRAEQPLVKLNCAAVPAGLVESELFGHERGAFTGATERRVGRFELANGGTIFLDEIGELPLDTQAKLLRVLQEREFERVGGSKTLRTDVRVIAATNRDLSAMIEARRFRADLFYRLDVFPVSVPPLRERPEDVALLSNLFISRYAPKIGRAATRLSERAAARLSRYAWPGNVRELENVIERALILAPADAVELEVPEAVVPLAAAPPPAAPPAAPAAAPPAPRSDRLEEVERGHIVATLDEVGWRIEGPSGAAARLGLRPSTLRSRMQKLGIRRDG